MSEQEIEDKIREVRKWLNDRRDAALLNAEQLSPGTVVERHLRGQIGGLWMAINRLDELLEDLDKEKDQ